MLNRLKSFVPLDDAQASQDGKRFTGGNYPSPTITGTPTNIQNTGGNYPAQPVSSYGTGGNYPAAQVPLEQGSNPLSLPISNKVPSTGGNYSAQTNSPPSTGGNYPAGTVPQPSSTNLQWDTPGKPAPTSAANTQSTGGNYPAPTVPSDPSKPVTLQGGFSPYNVVNDTMSQFLDPNGSYMRNAARRGLEQAAAGGNRAGSSVAAGAAQRASLEAAAPLLSEALGLQRQREQLAFQGEQNQLERNRDYTQAQLQDWMSSRTFNREFYGALSMMPINSAYQLNSMIQAYALDNPEIYTADVISGMSNFFTQNFSQILNTYFPSIYGAGTQATTTGGGG
jgi:hypothetical protein